MIQKPEILSKEQRYEVYGNSSFGTMGDERIAYCTAQRDDTFQKTLKAVVELLKNYVDDEPFGDSSHLMRQFFLPEEDWQELKQLAEGEKGAAEGANNYEARADAMHKAVVEEIEKHAFLERNGDIRVPREFWNEFKEGA